MGYPFVEWEVTLPGDPSAAVGAPPSQHPASPPGWNGGIEVYKEAFGEAAWEQWKTNSFPRPMPEDSMTERLELEALKEAARVAFFTKSARTGRRATHTPGVAARGEVTVVSDPDFPEHPFFEAGRSWKCRLRHANASFIDDASSVVRGCALKFADSESESPLDLVMNSGPTGAFWNLESFMDFVRARIAIDPEKDDWEGQKQWMMRRPMGFIGSIESIRLAPASYAQICYYSKIVFPFLAKDGKPRMVKFRVVPVGLEVESGLPPRRRQVCIWSQGRDPDDDRPTDYLRQEWAARIQKAPVEYTLQLQVRDRDPEADTHEVFNMCHLWDLEKYPWRDLAHVRLDEVLPDDVSEPMRMWLGDTPPSLGVLGAYSHLDYRSLGVARVQVYEAGQYARRGYNWLEGPPPPFGDRRY